MLVGFSLSGIVKGILDKKLSLKDIRIIYSGTALRKESLSRWIHYSILSVGDYSYEEAKKVTKEVFYSGKLKQPRLMGYGDDIYNPFPAVLKEEEVSKYYYTNKKYINEPKRFIWADELLKDFI